MSATTASTVADVAELEGVIDNQADVIEAMAKACVSGDPKGRVLAQRWLTARDDDSESFDTVEAELVRFASGI